MLNIDTHGIIYVLRLITSASHLTPFKPCYTIQTPALLARDESQQPSRRNGAGFVLSSEGEMKRKWIKGHKRIMVPVGIQTANNQGYSGGWDVSCVCGWQGDNQETSHLAQKTYSQHVDHQINHCPVTCKRCGEEKLLSEMKPDYRYICLKCASIVGTEWKKKNPTQFARAQRDHHLRKHFGISIDDAERILSEQNKVCAICKQEITDCRHSPHVDHDHATGKVRGILCFACNRGLGSFKDDIGRLRAAIEYLERTS